MSPVRSATQTAGGTTVVDVAAENEHLRADLLSPGISLVVTWVINSY
jgi:hypothetical protein